MLIFFYFLIHIIKLLFKINKNKIQYALIKNVSNSIDFSAIVHKNQIHLKHFERFRYLKKNTRDFHPDLVQNTETYTKLIRMHIRLEFR